MTVIAGNGIINSDMEELKKLAEETGVLLRRRKLSISLAESCTGGLLGAAITEIPGSSDYFWGSIVAYHNRVKKKALKVPASNLRKSGAVSAEVALSMARGSRKATGSRIGLSITGIAGPSGGTEEKPVGLVYVGLDARKIRGVRQFRLSGSRSEIRLSACIKALELLLQFLKDNTP